MSGAHRGGASGRRGCAGSPAAGLGRLGPGPLGRAARCGPRNTSASSTTRVPGRAGGQARPFGAADLTAVLATLPPAAGGGRGRGTESETVALRARPWGVGASVASEPPRQLDVEGVEVEVADLLEELGGPGVAQALGQLVAGARRGRRRRRGGGLLDDASPVVDRSGGAAAATRAVQAVECCIGRPSLLNRYALSDPVAALERGQ